MPTSEDILIADEIATALAGGAFSVAVNVERLYVPDWDVKDELSGAPGDAIGNLQVGVWHDESSGEPWERKQLLDSYRIGVGVCTKVAKATRADLDSLCDLVDEIRRFVVGNETDGFNAVVLSGGRRYEFDGWEYLVRFSQASLDRNKDADGVVRYTGGFKSALMFDYRSSQ